MPDETKQAVWCDTQIDGPHKEWKGEVFVENARPYNKVASRVNNSLGRVVFRRKAPLDFLKYDVLFSHFGYRAWHDYMYVKGLPLKKIVRFYGCDIGITPKQPGWIVRYKRIFDEYDILLCEGPHMANELKEIGAPEDKIRWVHLGIDPNLVAKELTPVAELVNPLCILIAGTFSEKKGFEYALEGIKTFAEDTNYPTRLTLIGDSSHSLCKDVCRKSNIEALIREMQFLRNIDIIKSTYVPLNELYAAMKRNLVFVSPSVTASNGDIEGGFPVTLTHATANGMILIGTDHCDLPEIVRDDVNGYVCEQRSSNNISQCLKRLIDSDETSLSEKRKASLQLVSEEFNATKLAKNILNTISEKAF